MIKTADMLSVQAVVESAEDRKWFRMLERPRQSYLSDDPGHVVVRFSSGGDEEDESTEDHRHQEAEEHENEEHAEATSVKNIVYKL